MVKTAAPRHAPTRFDVLPGVALAALLSLALGERLINLEAFSPKFDEGIRAEQLLLMRAGFRPVRDIFAAQGPLSLDIFYGPYLLFGETLAAARAAVVLYSLLGIAAVFGLAAFAGGRTAAALSALLLVASPLYLKNSRLALLEVPAMVPATAAVGSALAFQVTGERRWLIVSAVCLALALLIKPMVLPAAAAIGAALVLRPNCRPADLVRYAGVVAAVAVVVVALYGPEQVWQQVVHYRATARADADWSLKENWSILREELRDEQLGFYALALAGGLLLSLRQPRLAIPLVAWALATFGLLLVYSPLQFKHAAILFPPLALLAGLGLAAALAAVGRRLDWRASCTWTRGPLAALVVLCLATLLWYLASLPAVWRQHAQVISAATERGGESFAEEAALIPRLSRPDEFVLVDEPIVAYNSRRLVPPSLVDTSHYRIRSGALTGGEVVAAVERRDVRLLFLFSDGLRELEAFERLVDQRYRAVRIWERQNGKDRALYLRDDADLETARASVTSLVDRPVRAEFGGAMRLLGYNLSRDELRPGSSATLTLHWEGIAPMATDYSVITRLVGPPGQAEAQTQRGLGGGGEGTSAWEVGRWVVRSQTLAIPARAQPGDYRLYVTLYDSKARSSPPVTEGGEPGASDVLLGHLRVR